MTRQVPETLEDAKHVARLCASRQQPCELLVHDAYHRVIVRAIFQVSPGR